MKVCFISPEYGGGGGLGVSTKRITDNLIKKGIDVHVIVPDVTDKYFFNEKSYIKSKENIHRIGPSRWTPSSYSPHEIQNFIYYIIQLHKKYSFDIFHGFWFETSGFLATYLAKCLGKKSIVSIRGHDIARNIFDSKIFAHIQWVLKNCDMITSNASDLVKICDTFYPCASKTRLIYNSIDPREFYYSEKIKLNLTGTIIGTVGLIRQNKGFLWILDAFKKLLKTRDATFLLIGDFIATEKEFYIHKIQELELQDKIVITGIVDHKLILNYIVKLNIFVIASTSEGCPNALLEAMYCKRPVVATRVGGMADIIEHKKNGYLVEPRSSEEIYHAIIELLENKVLREAISLEGYTTVKKKYGLDTEIGLWLKAYQDLMKGTI